MLQISQAIQDAKQKAIESATLSQADIACATKTVCAIILRAGKPIVSRFGPTEGLEIQKAQYVPLVQVTANVHKTSGAPTTTRIDLVGRLEAFRTEPKWHTLEFLASLEVQSRELLGDSLYDLCATNLSTLNPNPAKWQEMLKLLATWFDSCVGGESENKEFTRAARFQRRLAEGR